MEIRDYLKIYWAHRWLIIIIIILTTATALLVAASRPPRTGVSVSFAINRTNREATTQYQYDGYYALQAADLFAQTVVSWFSTPSVLREVYEQAKLDPEIVSLNSLPARFSVKKYSAQNIVVKFTERNETRAKSVAAGMTLVMEAKAAKLNTTGEGKSLFEIVGSLPVIARVQVNEWLIGIAAAVLSGLGALFIVAGRHYLRS